MRKQRKWMAAVLSAALVLAGLPGAGWNSMTASAAKAPVKLNKTGVTIRKGKKVTLKVKKVKAKKIKSVKWSTNKKKVATVSKKGVVKGVKTGSAKITATVKYLPKKSKRTATKKLVCKVKVKAAAAATQTPAAVPSTSPAVAVSQTPSVSNTPLPEPTSTAKTYPYSLRPVYQREAEENVEPSADMTAAQLMENMNQGWNLANTFESCGFEGATTVDAFETGWGAPKTTKKMIQGIKASGFDSIRIPVAWSNLMTEEDGEFIVSEAYLARVAKIVDYCMEEDMYVVLNEHYDGGWWGLFGSPDEALREKGMKKYTAIWTQVADYFKDYDYRLIFESANEELGPGFGGANQGLNTPLDADGKPDEHGTVGTLSEDELFAKVAEINQKFVNIVRESGGNNARRQLLIAGYTTNIQMTCDERFIMPTDRPENGKDKLSVSVHFYDPSDYCISEDKTSGYYLDSWGTEEQYQAMHQGLDALKKFTDQGYGVIIGEYGPQGMGKKGVPEFIREVMIYCEINNYAPMLWSTSMYNRNERAVAYTDIWEVLAEVTGAENIPLEEGAESTGMIPVQIMTEDTADIKVVATWEGKWTRTNNKSKNVGGECIRGDDEIGWFETTKNEGGIDIASNAWWWQLFFTYDWSKIENRPGVRITMATEQPSKDADFQMGYCKKVDDSGYTLNEFTHADYVEKCMTFSQKKLAVKPYIVMSSGTQGATITKIEILDIKPKQ